MDMWLQQTTKKVYFRFENIRSLTVALSFHENMIQAAAVKEQMVCTVNLVVRDLKITFFVQKSAPISSLWQPGTGKYHPLGFDLL